MESRQQFQELQALRRSKIYLEDSLYALKLEEKEAFTSVSDLDELLRKNHSIEIEQKRKTKLQVAENLKWNIIGEAKAIIRCDAAIKEAEMLLSNSNAENTLKQYLSN